MDSEWLRRFVPPGGRPPAGEGAVRLVCFPHAGGAASTYLPLSNGLAPDVDVVAVQYPGRQDRLRQEPFTDIHRLAERLAEVIAAADDVPLAFFGHSMGAVLAYETARRLIERGRPGPSHLFLSGRGAPDTRPEALERLRTDADILQVVRRLGGTVPRLLEDPDLREMVMPALRADYRAIDSYSWKAGPPLDVPISVLIGDRDPLISVESTVGWRDRTTAGTTTHVFAGGHFYLDERLPEVVEAILDGLGPLVGTAVGPASSARGGG